MYLLHVSQHILPAVKHSSSLLRIQLVDKVSSVVFIRVLVPNRIKSNFIHVDAIQSALHTVLKQNKT